MGNALTATFRNTEVRIVNDDPVTVVLKDVADALGYRDAHRLKRSIRDKYKGTREVGTPGGVQEMICVTRPGITQALATLRPQDTEKAEAVESFQDWMYEDVMESVYDTGSYSTRGSKPAEYNDDPIIQMRRDQLEARREREEMKSEINQLREERDEAIRKLDEAREPDADVPEKGVRSEINELVRAHAAANSEFSRAWNRLYKEYRQRASIDLQARARHAGSDVGALDIADDLNVLDEVYRVAYDLYA